MNALIINSENNIVTVEYEEMTPDRVKKYLNELKTALNTTWYGVCPLFGLAPTDSGTRVLRRWYSTNQKDAQPIPDHHWRMLLILLNGQTKIV